MTDKTQSANRNQKAVHVDTHSGYKVALYAFKPHFCNLLYSDVNLPVGEFRSNIL